MQKTVSDNPSQVIWLRKIESVLRNWQADVTEPTIQLRREIGDSKTMNEMADLMGQAKDKTYFDEFHGLIEDFRNEEETLMTSRQKSSVETMSLA